LNAARLNALSGRIGERLIALNTNADAQALDVTRQVIRPVDLVMSGVSIARGKGTTGDYVNVATMMILPGAGRVAETAIAKAARLGREGERAAGIVGSKVGVLINGRMRFPDEITPTLIKEVKNVARQGWTKQLKDYAALARQDGKAFELWVRESTRLTAPLQAAVDRGEVVIIRGLK